MYFGENTSNLWDLVNLPGAFYLVITERLSDMSTTDPDSNDLPAPGDVCTE